jgi:GNAT superfamily N-acetyltransferase
MASNVEVRPAMSGDARGIAKVHVASWKAAYTGLLADEKMAQLDIEERERAWRERLKDQQAHRMRAWVAVLDDEIVGYAFTQASPDGDLIEGVHELTALYLLPSVWRQGVGSVLLTVVERALRDAGIRSLALWVIEGNESAKSFYEARGWSFERREPSFKDFGAAALRYRRTL